MAGFFGCRIERRTPGGATLDLVSAYPHYERKEIEPDPELAARAVRERTEEAGLVRPFVGELIARGQVTAAEWAVPMNTYERRALLPALVDEVFVKHFLHCASNIGQGEPGTYPWAVVHELVPEAYRRLERQEARPVGVLGASALARNILAASRERMEVSTRGLAGEPSVDVPELEPLGTVNQWAVTAKDEKVRSLFGVPPALQPQEAVRLASWLIVAAEMAGYPHPLETAQATVKAIRNT